MFFEEKDLVSFGEYLLSDERTDLILSQRELSSDPDAVKSVYQADLANWINKTQEK